MLTLIIITSFKIVFVYGAMQPDMILYPLRLLFEKILNKLPLTFEQYAKKPLFDCLFCMASVWGIVFTITELDWQFSFSFFISYLFLLFGIAGCNYMLALLISYVHTYVESTEERIVEINAPALDNPLLGYKYHIFRNGKYLGIATYWEDKYKGLCFMDRHITGDVVFDHVDYWTSELE